MVKDLDTDTCMMAHTKIVATQGRLHTNSIGKGTNFVMMLVSVSTHKTLSVRDLHVDRHLEFLFFCCPHFGAKCERLVRNFKKIKFAIFKNQRLILPVITSTKRLVEQTMNPRTSTPLGGDPKDAEPMTLKHFLLGRSVAAEALVPVLLRFVDCRMIYKVAHACSKMI